MKHLVDRSIGARAAEEILKRDGPIHVIMRQLGLERKSFHTWQTGLAVPSTYALLAMYHQGYDVIYILTGKRTK